MVDLDKLVQAIRKIESNGVTNAIGDSGQALGAFQMHPAAFWEWSGEPEEGMTWDEWFADAVHYFFEKLFEKFPDMPADEAAVVYHRHCLIMRATPEDFAADDYKDRFDKVWNNA